MSDLCCGLGLCSLAAEAPGASDPSSLGAGRMLLSHRMLLTLLLVLHFFSSQGKNFLVDLGEEIDQFQLNNATEYSSHGNDYSNQGSDIMCKYWRFCQRWYTCR